MGTAVHGLCRGPASHGRQTQSAMVPRAPWYPKNTRIFRESSSSTPLQWLPAGVRPWHVHPHVPIPFPAPVSRAPVCIAWPVDPNRRLDTSRVRADWCTSHLFNSLVISGLPTFLSPWFNTLIRAGEKPVRRRARGLVVMTSPLHGEGRRFESGRAHLLFRFGAYIQGISQSKWFESHS